MPDRPVNVDEQQLVDLFLELVQLNTPSKQEKAASEVGRILLEHLGFECKYDGAGDRVGGTVGNLIAFKAGNVLGGTPIFLSAHFDTVEPTAGLQPIVEGDIIRSDGNTILGADDKCGIAAILQAMRIIHEQNIPHGDIQLLLTICEEIGLVGAKELAPSDIRTAVGFVLDSGPPVGSMVYAAPTHDIFEVFVHGKGSHAGALPEEGISAIAVAARAISRMKLGRVDPETTANVGIISGGTATNVIPAEAYLKCEVRSRNAAKVDKVREQMIALLHEEANAAGASLEISVQRAYSGYELPMDSLPLRMATAAAERIGFEPQMRLSGGGADANVFNANGFPCTVLGCGMMNIHQHDEYVRISDMVRSTQYVVSLVETASRWAQE